MFPIGSRKFIQQQNLYLKLGDGDPWAGQDSDTDSANFELTSDSLERRVTLGAEPPIGS